jgi:hypothetical protein
MSAQLVLRLASQVGNAVGNLQLRAVNTVNTPIVGTPTWLASGVAIADDYTLTILSKGGTAVTVKVECNAKNPYQNLSGVSAIADGSTPNTGIVPGVSIVLSNSSDIGWKALLTVGAYMDNSGNITDVLGFGVVQAGYASTGVRVCWENVGDAPAQNCVAYSLPGLFFYGTAYATFIASIAPHSDPSRHKLAPKATSVITFVNWATDGVTGHKKADVLVNGNPAIIGALFDGATVYQYGAGNGYVDANDYFAGLAVVLCLTTVDPTSASITLKVADGWNWVQYAPDVTGSPGTYANQDMVLTASGQFGGTIPAGSAAFFWVLWSVPSYAQASDMRKMVQRSRGLTT